MFVEFVVSFYDKIHLSCNTCKSNSFCTISERVMQGYRFVSLCLIPFFITLLMLCSVFFFLHIFAMDLLCIISRILIETVAFNVYSFMHGMRFYYFLGKHAYSKFIMRVNRYVIRIIFLARN